MDPYSHFCEPDYGLWNILIYVFLKESTQKYVRKSPFLRFLSAQNRPSKHPKENISFTQKT
jgi:hypothetical protein